ncbi:MAG: hypothetical protein ACYCYK_00290 [Candidatus Dormibacteria bacterium]
MATLQRALHTARVQLTAIRDQEQELTEQLQAAQHSPVLQLVARGEKQLKQSAMEREQRQREWDERRASEQVERDGGARRRSIGVSRLNLGAAAAESEAIMVWPAAIVVPGSPIEEQGSRQPTTRPVS